MVNIYVASSWKNETVDTVIANLRELGHTVYDFKEDNGFHWSDIDPAYLDWTPREFTKVLAEDAYCDMGFNTDMAALDNCDICLLVLPSGRSSHLELGYAIGKGKGSIILLDEMFEPELMYCMCNAVAPDSKLETLKTTVEYVIQCLDSSI